MSEWYDADDFKRREDAARLISDEARRIAATFSRRTAEATSVTSDPGTAEVAVETDKTTAPMAEPFEYAEYHPLFGDKRHWYRQPLRPYMDEAVARQENQAAREYFKVIDDWCQREGWTP